MYQACKKREKNLFLFTITIAFKISEFIETSKSNYKNNNF